MTKSKNLFKNISLFFCLIPMLFLSLFVVLPKHTIKGVYADYVESNYVFHASDLYNLETYFERGNAGAFYTCLFSSDIYYTNSILSIDPNFAYCTSSSGTILYTHCNLINNGVINDSFTISRGSSFGLYFNVYATGIADKYYFYVDGYCSLNFNANVYKVHLELKDTTYNQFTSNNKYLHITYYDRNEEFIDFVFLVSKNYIFNTRTYFLTNDFSGNEMFDQGYENGYNAGVVDGNEQGYNEGYSIGTTVGYQDGYVAGLESSNKYSFNSLIGAVIDAPVSAFTSLLNFEILGFNILGFITGLLTLALIVFIIKLCLGGK